jgi:hypothetical protein
VVEAGFTEGVTPRGNKQNDCSETLLALG